MNEWLADRIVVAPPLLFSLVLHEYAHARTALAFGDPTAKMMGRASLNPLRHLDLMGTMVLLVTLRFGWAKPVPVNPANLHPRRAGNIAVSLAGVATNLLIAVACGVILRAEHDLQLGERYGLLVGARSFLVITMAVNLVLCIFNLVPLFPLDGHHVLREMLPATRQIDYMRWQLRFGRLLLLGLIFAPMAMKTAGPLSYLFGSVIEPAIAWTTGGGT